MSWQQRYFDLLYRYGRPEWLTGEVQPGLEEAVWEGAVRGPRVLDVGCGAGDNSLFLARHGFAVTAVDVSPTAIAMARAKSAAAGQALDLHVLDAVALAQLGQRFDTIVDFGLFHLLDPARRRLYVQALRAVSHPRTRLLLQCCSARGGQARPLGPRLFSQDDLHEAFGDGWQIDWVRAAAFERRLRPQVPAWLASLRPAMTLTSA